MYFLVWNASDGAWGYEFLAPTFREASKTLHDITRKYDLQCFIAEYDEVLILRNTIGGCVTVPK